VEISSIDGNSYVGEYAVDGSLLTAWHTAKAVGKNRLPSEYIVIDLQGEYSIDQISLDWDSFYATDYILSVSLDYTNWTSVLSVSGQDGANDTHTFTPVTARYVYLETTTWGNGTWRNWLNEFRILGQ